MRRPPGHPNCSAANRRSSSCASSSAGLRKEPGKRCCCRVTRAWGRPLLLIVDDLPWLDRASALVLGMVARRLGDLPVALLAACRPGEPSFFDQGNLPVARVEPLSEEAATELLASRYPVMTARVRRRLLDAALGNPLALLEL